MTGGDAPPGKRCTGCWMVRPLDQFHRHGGHSDGRATRCKDCSNTAHDAYVKANPEKAAQGSRRWKKAHPEKARAVIRRWRQANPGKGREYVDRYRAALRDRVFAHYGQVCACPGCGAAEDLTIDHVEGDGRRQRQELFGRDNETTGMYRWLIENNFPAGFQVLCRGCNTSKGSGPACLIHCPPATRKCSACGTVKPLAAFRRARAQCRDCWNAKQRQHSTRNESAELADRLGGQAAAQPTEENHG